MVNITNGNHDKVTMVSVAGSGSSLNANNYDHNVHIVSSDNSNCEKCTK